MWTSAGLASDGQPLGPQPSPVIINIISILKYKYQGPSLWRWGGRGRVFTSPPMWLGTLDTQAVGQDTGSSRGESFIYSRDCVTAKSNSPGLAQGVSVHVRV